MEGSVRSENKGASANASGRPLDLQFSGIRIPAALAFGLILVWQICVVCLSARAHAFWYDELITDFLSALPSFSRNVDALRASADGMPPVYYVAVRLARLVPVDEHIAVRIPSILGYVVTLTGILLFIRKRLGLVAGLVGVLFVSLTPFRAYAFEARSYALLTGSIAIAMVLWQRVDEKKWFAVLLCASLALAATLHYFAVLAVAVFSFAELGYSYLTGRVRWKVWFAYVGAAVAWLALAVPFLLHFRSAYSRYFWSPPFWASAFDCYATYLGVPPEFAVALVIVFLALVVVLIRTGRSAVSEVPAKDGFERHELILIGALCLYPAMLGVLAKVFYSLYAPRYGWPGILGMVCAFVFLVCRARLDVRYILAALLLPAFYQDARLVRNFFAEPVAENRANWSDIAEKVRQRPGVPVVVASATKYLVALKYAPSDIRDRLVNVSDTALSIKYQKFDSVDRGNELLSGFLPFKLESPSEFERKYRSFFLLVGGDADWFTSYVIDNHYDMRFVARGEGTLYAVDAPH